MGVRVPLPAPQNWSGFARFQLSGEALTKLTNHSLFCRIDQLATAYVVPLGGDMLPRQTGSEPGNDATSGERVATAQPDRVFIEAFGRDATRVEVWRGRAMKNGLQFNRKTQPRRHDEL